MFPFINKAEFRGTPLNTCSLTHGLYPHDGPVVLPIVSVPEELVPEGFTDEDLDLLASYSASSCAFTETELTPEDVVGLVPLEPAELLLVPEDGVADVDVPGLCVLLPDPGPLPEAPVLPDEVDLDASADLALALVAVIPLVLEVHAPLALKL